MNFKKQFISIVAVSAVLLSTAAPVFADTTINITGNGEASNNSTGVSNTNTTTVLQSNTANVTNSISSNADSGGNKTVSNTGGDVTVQTGAASTSTNVENTLNSNFAQVSCCSANNNTSVLVGGNGEKSDNSVGLSTANTTQVTQQNEANVVNSVDANASTGGNKANGNTGGDVMINSGPATSVVTVSTTANANAAVIGAPADGGAAGSLSAVIGGNGENSDNSIALESAKSAEIWQANAADVVNSVDSNAKSGGNKAESDTGGDVTIISGAAGAGVGVDNTVNFNSAELNCGCFDNVLAKVADNGENSDNTIEAGVSADQGIFQGGNDLGNTADLVNEVGANGKSGWNNASGNTGPAVVDPTMVVSGASTSVTDVSNAGNVNVVGGPVSLPGNFDFQFEFNWASIWGAFH